jgi:hypothetical protein
VHHRLRLLAFPARTSPMRRLAKREISRFPRKERPYMPGSSTAPSQRNARSRALRRLAFRYLNSVGTRDEITFAAQWLACMLPCRRFADILTDVCARLGADVVR